MANTDLGTYKAGDPFTFTTTLSITIDGTPVTDLASWTPVCKFRSTTTSTTAVSATLLTTAGTVLTWGLPETTTADMAGTYFGDIQVTNPSGATGYKKITAPGDDDYLTVEFTSKVARS